MNTVHVTKLAPCIIAMLDDEGAIVWVGVTAIAEPATLIRNYWNRAKRGQMALSEKVNEWLKKCEVPPNYRLLEHLPKDATLAEARNRRDYWIVSLNPRLNEPKAGYSSTSNILWRELAGDQAGERLRRFTWEFNRCRQVARDKTSCMFWGLLDEGVTKWATPRRPGKPQSEDEDEDIALDNLPSV